jgi:hypothetical protein
LGCATTPRQAASAAAGALAQGSLGQGTRVIMLAVGALFQVITIPTTPLPPAHLPFRVGETFEYRASSKLGGGSATLRVAAIDTVRGVPSWKFVFSPVVSGLFGLYKSQSDFTSWTGVADFISRRFLKDISDNGKYRKDDHLIYPDSGFFRDNNYDETVPTTKTPLDDVAFFYFIRYIPLASGKTYVFRNYFNATKGAVTIQVLGRELMAMPDGSTISCLVLYPIVDDPPHGMFLKKWHSRLWLTDDARRIPVQIQAGTEFGSVTFKLVKITEPPQPQ